MYVWDNPGGGGVGGGGGGGGGGDGDGGLGSGAPADPLEDPVLVSYARMIAADVLCVWRRTWRGPQDHSPSSPQQAHHHHQQRHSLRHSPKELWVFWYGDDPDLSNLLAPELLKSGQYTASSASYTCFLPSGAVCLYYFI